MLLNKEKGRDKMAHVILEYNKLKEWRNRLQERDITTKFVIPWLQALNWNIYGVTKHGLEVSEQGFPGQIKEGQPDIRLQSKTGKIVIVEVKKRLPEEPIWILKGYARYKTRKGKSLIVVLTDFRKTYVYTRGRKGLQKRGFFALDNYLEKFNDLWRLLSNSPKATRKRAALKATG